MPFTPNADLETQTSGSADWDTGLNANFQILDRGVHFKATAGTTINTGDVCWINSNYIFPYNAASFDLSKPHGIAHSQVDSGEEETFVALGIIESVGTWSAHISPGLPVYVSAETPGFLVSSYGSRPDPAGIAIRKDKVLFRPWAEFPTSETKVHSFASVDVSSDYVFTFDVGRRGIVRELIVATDSADAYKVQFWPNSDVTPNSGYLYNTITTSVDGGAGDYDVQSLYYVDNALWPYKSTAADSASLIWGSIQVQSASAVASSNFSVTMVVERFR